jgi:hypothetical protein
MRTPLNGRARNLITTIGTPLAILCITQHYPPVDFGKQMWDVFRCTTPFYHLVYTNRYVDMLRSLIDIWRNEGFLPDGRRFIPFLLDRRMLICNTNSGNYNGRTQVCFSLAQRFYAWLDDLCQGGSNADNVLADAYVKGLDKVKSIDWKDAYKAIVRDAVVFLFCDLSSNC